MKKTAFFLLLASIAVFGSSCATILTSSNQTVKMVTDPPGATVEVNGTSRGTTPVDLTLKKGFKGETLVLKMVGYENRTIQPTVTFNPIAVLNLFGMIGWAIDAATGAMMKYDPMNYEVKLDKTKQ